MYSERVRQLIYELPNSGTLGSKTHYAQRENPVCDDVTRLELRVEKGWAESAVSRPGVVLELSLRLLQFQLYVLI